MSSRELLAVSQPAPNCVSPLDSLFSCRQRTAAYCADAPWEMAGPPQNLWLQMVGWNNCQAGDAWSFHAPSPKPRKNGKSTTATCCGGGNPLDSCWAAALLLLLGRLQQQEKPRPSHSPRHNDCTHILPADIKADRLSATGDPCSQKAERSWRHLFSQLFWTLSTTHSCPACRIWTSRN